MQEPEFNPYKSILKWVWLFIFNPSTEELEWRGSLGLTGPQLSWIIKPQEYERPSSKHKVDSSGIVTLCLSSSLHKHITHAKHRHTMEKHCFPTIIFQSKWSLSSSPGVSNRKFDILQSKHKQNTARCQRNTALCILLLLYLNLKLKTVPLK